MKHPKPEFRHFHDYYSRTYPRYESYTSREREHDLFNMMNSMIKNNNIEFEHNLYYDLSGGINPVFKTNVLCCLSDDCDVNPDSL